MFKVKASTASGKRGWMGRRKAGFGQGNKKYATAHKTGGATGGNGSVKRGVASVKSELSKNGRATLAIQMKRKDVTNKALSKARLDSLRKKEVVSVKKTEPRKRDKEVLKDAEETASDEEDVAQALKEIDGATYIEDFIDAGNTVPDEVQRCVSQMIRCHTNIRGLAPVSISLEGALERASVLVTQLLVEDVGHPNVSLENPEFKKKRQQDRFTLEQLLVLTAEAGDERRTLSEGISDTIQNKLLQLKIDYNNYNTDHASKKRTNATASETSTPRKRSRRSRRGRKPLMRSLRSQDKKSATNIGKSKEEAESSSDDNSSNSSDEPTWCTCNRVFFGRMVGCDNYLCPIEWYHFTCVGLKAKPKGKWYCPKCRGEKSDVMKPKLMFLKELSEFNKEMEGKKEAVMPTK